MRVRVSATQRFRGGLVCYEGARDLGHNYDVHLVADGHAIYCYPGLGHAIVV
jgi:hypothetical protein